MTDEGVRNSVFEAKKAARWIRAGRGAPPMRFADLAQATLDDPVLIGEINRLLDVKMRAGEAATSPRWPAIHDFLASELETAHAQAPADEGRPDVSGLDKFLLDTVRRFDPGPARPGPHDKNKHTP